MVVEPKVKGFICTTAHPKGCEESVRRQIEYTKQKKQVEGPKKVLVIGSSTGYGLASRIAVTYGRSVWHLSVKRRANVQRPPVITIRRLLKRLQQRMAIMQNPLTETVFQKK